MITRLDIEPRSILGFRASGTLTEEDYRQVVVPELDRATNEYGTIRVILKIENFQGLTAGAAMEDLKQLPKLRQIDRMAVVGEENWDQWMTDLSKFFANFIDTDIRFFRENRMDDALDWIREKAKPEATAAAQR
jgi:hypothetical protein